MNGSSAWFAKGPALEQYNTTIRPEIECTLKNVELPEGAPLFLNLYMIGKKEDKAKPIVMVCCVNPTIRKQAEASIRESNLLDRCPGFGLGSSALLLEAGSMPQLFAGMEDTNKGKSADTAFSSSQQKQSRPDDGPELQNDGQGEKPTKKSKMTAPKRLLNFDTPWIPRGAFDAVPSKVRIGRPITFASPATNGLSLQHATGGPVISIGSALYQLTAAHVTQLHREPDLGDHGADLDECEFDGQSDEDIDDQLATSRGSLSPEAPSQPSEDNSSNLDDQDPLSLSASFDSSLKSTTSGVPFVSDAVPDEEIHTTESGQVDHLQTTDASKWNQLPKTTFSSRVSGLDYYLAKLSHGEEQDAVASNWVDVETGHGHKVAILVTDIAGPTELPVNIYAVTQRGPIKGVLAGWTSVKRHKMTGFQRMLTVTLSEPLGRGDSGSAIIGAAQSGHYYGHVVFGVDGHPVAYVVPAPEVFADITVRFGHLPTLKFRYNDDQDRLFYKPREMKTPWEARGKLHHSPTSSYGSKASSYPHFSGTEASSISTSKSSTCVGSLRRAQSVSGALYHPELMANLILPGTSASSYMDSRYASLVIPDDHPVDISTDCDGHHMLTHLNSSLRPDPFHHMAKYIQGIARPSPTLDHAKPEESQALQVRKDDFAITAQAPELQEPLSSSGSNEGQGAEQENKSYQTSNEFNAPYVHEWSAW